MKKLVNVNEIESGLKYVTIYEVRAETFDGKTITVDRFFDEKKANEQLDRCYECYNDLYKVSWIMKEWVWF